MQKGNVNGALNLITNNMVGGILPLSEEVIKILVEKHPEPAFANEDSILEGPILLSIVRKKYRTLYHQKM